VPVITLTWPCCLLVDVDSNNMSTDVITKLPSGNAVISLCQIPQPTEGHGWTIKNGVLEPLWTDEEEKLTLPRYVIDDLLNDVQDSDKAEDGDCILRNGIDDTMDSDDSDEAQKQKKNTTRTLSVNSIGLVRFWHSSVK